MTKASTPFFRGGRGRGRGIGRGGCGRGRSNSSGIGIFIATTVIKMVTLKAIALRRRETPLKQISARKKVKSLKPHFLQVISLKLKLILHGI